jgi:hypothetical protein
MDMDGAHKPSLYQWVRLPLHGVRPPNDWRPVEFADLQPMRQRRGIDVSWTIANPTAGPGYFLTGDAASGRRPVVVTRHLEGCDVGHEGGASFGGCLAVCRQPGRGRERVPRMAHAVVPSGPFRSRRPL